MPNDDWYDLQRSRLAESLEQEPGWNAIPPSSQRIGLEVGRMLINEHGNDAKGAATVTKRVLGIMAAAASRDEDEIREQRRHEDDDLIQTLLGEAVGSIRQAALDIKIPTDQAIGILHAARVVESYRDSLR